jgi:hypothetical protein
MYKKYILWVKLVGGEEREGSSILTWMRITVAFFVRRLSIAHLKARWLPFSLSIATATNPFTLLRLIHWHPHSLVLPKLLVLFQQTQIIKTI